MLFVKLNIIMNNWPEKILKRDLHYALYKQIS